MVTTYLLQSTTVILNGSELEKSYFQEKSSYIAERLPGSGAWYLVPCALCLVPSRLTKAFSTTNSEIGCMVI